MKSIALRFSLLVAALALTVPSFMSAQVSGGTISGTITDPSNSVLPNTQVDITNLGTAETRIVVTNQDGRYAAPNLLPGDYEVKATAQGFGRTASHITVKVGDDPLGGRCLHTAQRAGRRGAAP